MKEFNLKIDGDSFHVAVESLSGNNAVVSVNGKAFSVEIEPKDNPQDEEISAAPVKTESVMKTSAGNAYKVKSPLPGLVLGVKVTEGQNVKEGQVVAVIEAMKMENEVVAPCDGTIASVEVSIDLVGYFINCFLQAFICDESPECLVV